MILVHSGLRRKRSSSDSRQLRLSTARRTSLDYCFPSRLEEMHRSRRGFHHNSHDSGCPAYLLGNLFYDKRRYEEAILHWEDSARAKPSYATVHRNLGSLTLMCVRSANALSCFEQLPCGEPEDARVLYERDQLWNRIGVSAGSPEELRNACLVSRAMTCPSNSRIF